MQAIRNEITAAVPLCDAQGGLNSAAVGWGRHPVWDCSLRGRVLRQKRWDYWCVMGPDRLFSFCLAHIGYLGLVGVYLLDYPSKRLSQSGTVRLFSRSPAMPPHTHGDTVWQVGGLRAEQHMSGSGGSIFFSTPNCGGKPLRAEFRLAWPEGFESLNVVVPWPGRNFQFTSKQLPLPVEGEVRWGEEVWRFERESSVAVRDFGRGMWPYATRWNWAALCGKQGSDVYGINLGGLWTDNTGATENGLILNGKLHKIFDDVVFEWDRKNPLQPWRMYSPDSDAVNLVLEPFYDKATNLNLGVLKMVVHQCFGYASGVVRVDGLTLVVDRALGWAEEQDARW